MMGRFVAGLGVGALSANVPIYQSEIAPKQIRGTLVVRFPFSSFFPLFNTQLTNCSAQTGHLSTVHHDRYPSRLLLRYRHEKDRRSWVVEDSHRPWPILLHDPWCWHPVHARVSRSFARASHPITRNLSADTLRLSSLFSASSDGSCSETATRMPGGRSLAFEVRLSKPMTRTSTTTTTKFTRQSSSSTRSERERGLRRLDRD